MHNNHPIFLRTAAALLLSVQVSAAAWAEHKGVPHDEHGEHEHHAEHAHDHDHDHTHELEAVEHTQHAATPAASVVSLKRTDAIAKALANGGEPIVVDVMGVVCDFCAKAMNKTFGRRDEVAAVHVDLDDKSLNLVLNEGASMSDEDIRKLVTRAGYRLSAIRRGTQALGAAAP